MATTIQISDQTWKKLNNLRRRGESFQDVIDRMFKMISKLKLRQELEMIE